LLVYKVDNRETGTFIALGAGFIIIAYCLATNAIGLLFLFTGILPLIAGLFGFSSQKESRRQIWLKRVKGFWFEFSHNKIGLIGLGLLMVFAVIAVLQDPIASLSYPNPDTQDLANKYAKPTWIGLVDPTSSNLPPTMNYTLDWTWSTLPANVTIESTSDTWKIRYTGDKDQKVVVLLNAKFNYTWDAPFNFYYTFIWSANPQLDPRTFRSKIRYSLELNLTTPDEDTIPIWDQHWWKYKAIPCYERNPNPPPTNYPGGPDYENYYKHQEKPWLPELDDRPAYDLYAVNYSGQIPTFTSKVVNETVVYTITRYPPIRLGFKGHLLDDMVNELFSPPGEFTLQLYVTFLPTMNNATCEVDMSNFKIDVPGRVWGLLGTEFMGRDCWSRLIYGARVSLAVGLSSAIIATSIGILYGIVAGYRGGWIDEGLMRTVDILLCLPVLPLLMVLVTFFGRSVIYIVLIIAVFGWQGLSRLIRSQVLSIREMSFVESAVASGASSSYIMTKHIIPNVMPIALADFILSVPGAILLEAALSFIGFGDPSTPTWGREYSFMQDLAELSYPKIGVIWWWFIPPGIMITLLCVAFVFVGHAVDEIVNPRLRRRR
jgi:ABC-type dipeptide/oligopeptide/nickel transport system permease subunit